MFPQRFHPPKPFDEGGAKLRADNQKYNEMLNPVDNKWAVYLTNLGALFSG
jgi:hypothetical protein